MNIQLEDALLDEQLAEMEAFELSINAQQGDAKLCAPNIGATTPGDFYMQFLGFYLLKMDLVNAKFLWKRIPAAIRNNSLHLGMLWKLGQLLWRRDITAFFAAAASILADTSLPEVVLFITKRLQEKQIERTLNLVKASYSCISAEVVATYFNLPVDEATALLISQGWTICDSNKYLIPPDNNVMGAPVSVLPSEASNNELMSKLSEFMCFIENH